MTEVFRRVYRIFAHAWFSHREAFWRVERETGIYVFFKAVCDEYRLIQEDNYTIPPEAEGVDEEEQHRGEAEEDFVAPGIMRRDTVRPEQQEEREREAGEGNTTKRHKHGQSSTGSVGLASIADRSTGVSTVIHEEVEEDEEDIAASPDHEVGGTGVPELVEEEADKAEGVAEDSEGYDTVVEISEDEVPTEDAEPAEPAAHEQQPVEETQSEDPLQSTTEEPSEQPEDKEAEDPVPAEPTDAEPESHAEQTHEDASESAAEHPFSEPAEAETTEPVTPIDDTAEDSNEAEAAAETEAEAGEEKAEEKKPEIEVTETQPEDSAAAKDGESETADAADADEAGKTVSD